MKIYYSVNVGDLSVEHRARYAPYKFITRKGTTYCSINFTKDGALRSSFDCLQCFCLIKNLSH